MTNQPKTSAARKRWHPLTSEPQQVAKLKASLNIPLPLATIMAQRGFLLTDEGQEFLYPTLRALPSPFLMKGMQEAVEIIHHALKAQHPIVIYGDYDVDGVTATAVLVKFFNHLGVTCCPCHPDRFQHGYGLKAELVEGLSPERAGVVITVDCGISDLAPVARLVAMGWQVIVTDHHQPPEQLPAAHAILNPWQAGCQFPSKDLAGVGVAFFLAMGLRSYLHQQGCWRQQTAPNLKKLLDLVAVGTISDMVPLKGTNRILAKAGLEVLVDTDNQGLAKLLTLCNFQRGQQLSTEDISFQIGPRLNAAGRMGDAGRASTLLSTTDPAQIDQLAEVINQENLARRELTSQLVAEAIAMVVAQEETERQPCLILHQPTWHLGLLGIISSKLVDRFHKPTIIFGGTGTLKGSARSIPGINIHEIIAACAARVIEYGGHSCAAGLSIKEENLRPFAAMANEVLSRYQGPLEQQPTLTVDFVVTDSTEFIDLETTCAKLAPFGQGNPEPIFTTDRPCRLRNMQVIGKEKNHLRFSAFLTDRWLDGVGFGFARVAGEAVRGEAQLTLAFSLKENRFNGQTKPQIMLHDVLI